MVQLLHEHWLFLWFTKSSRHIRPAEDHALTGREVGADGATGQRSTGGIHGDSIVGTRKQVHKLEFLAESINQDGFSSNWSQMYMDKDWIRLCDQI